MKLFCDLKTDDEKANFFLSGRAHETGVISKAIQNDVAMAYQRCAGYQSEIERLRAQNAELVEALKGLVEELEETGFQGEWNSYPRARAALPSSNPEAKKGEK